MPAGVSRMLHLIAPVSQTQPLTPLIFNGIGDSLGDSALGLDNGHLILQIGSVNTKPGARGDSRQGPGTPAGRPAAVAPTVCHQASQTFLRCLAGTASACRWATSQPAGTGPSSGSRPGSS